MSHVKSLTLDEHVEEQRRQLQKLGVYKPEDIAVILSLFRVGYMQGRCDVRGEMLAKLDRENLDLRVVVGQDQSHKDREHRVITNQ